MRIKYREPYWVKFNWDLSNHHENQYVTEFNKNENLIFREFQHNEKFIITCRFKIEEDYKFDPISMIFGKPGKNMGLTYNSNENVVAFEFWTKGEIEDKFNYLLVEKLTEIDLKNGVTITIIKNKNTFTVYKNYKKNNLIEFENELIDDYRESGLFIGCSNPGTTVPEHRYHGEVDLEYFSIINNVNKIDIAKDLHKSKVIDLTNKNYYRDILCLYDFKTISNLGIVYDESKHTNFMEKVPNELIAN